MNAPLTTTDELHNGDVVTVSVQLRDRRSGDLYWWKRFCVVLGPPLNYRYFTALTLKLRPEDVDTRDIDITRDVVVKLPEHEWPQGVIAMRMKYIMTGRLKLDNG